MDFWALALLAGLVLPPVWLAVQSLRDPGEASGELPTRAGPHGARLPLSASYQARVELDARAIPLVMGGKGQARIAVAPQTLAQRLGRWPGRSFRFQW